MKRGSITVLGLILGAVLLFAASARAQMPMGSGTQKPNSDTAIVFQPARPLIVSNQDLAREYPNTWGLTISFSDYGFGGGLFLGHSFSDDMTALISVDAGSAQASQEVDFLEVNQVNRVFVIPIMLSLQYRVFRGDLSDNLRPYVTAGAGPVVAMTTPYSQDFFSAFGDSYSKIVPGGFVGVGANFGTDPKNNFGVNIRYFIIPYPGTIESTTTESLTSLSGLFLTVGYGFNF